MIATRWTDQDRLTAHLRGSVISVPIYLSGVLIVYWRPWAPQFVWASVVGLCILNLGLSLLALWRARRAPAHLLMSLRMLFRREGTKDSIRLAYWRTRPTVAIEKRGLSGYSATEVLKGDVQIELVALDGDRTLWASSIPWGRSPREMWLTIPGRASAVRVERANEERSFTVDSDAAWDPDEIVNVSLQLLWYLVRAR